MKRLIILVISCFLTLNVWAQKGSDAILGVWLNQDKDAKVQIFKKGDVYFGKITWLKNPKTEEGQERTDLKNPKEELRTRKVNGLEILHGFKYDSDDNKWAYGTIYDPKSGKTYSCKMTLDGADKLNVRGYVGVSLIGRTDIWTRSN